MQQAKTLAVCRFGLPYRLCIHWALVPALQEDYARPSSCHFIHPTDLESGALEQFRRRQGLVPNLGTIDFTCVSYHYSAFSPVGPPSSFYGALNSVEGCVASAISICIHADKHAAVWT